ncbi:Nif3-like dinuclear metal center hexameric protein [Methanoculleus sp. FWC-SCC1]|uniref:Nif3-like dinuclear metal center hexameric protein n=2 Tax=Methanoculleus frigidifontis TaxID=2584085 RepID=A0ABT8M971_9EURY|nr:Nif3-like dinuclear metal center hexameric protein [Methanoculleus sp. FWC-SCC1]MDN7024470.1 Nif3-like dinuclear metal center hexameric protein [Methanoculleus sp. FWC-SCC1]
MEIAGFIREMERIADPCLAEEFDCGRIGLIVEGKPEVGTVCCALDATEAVVDRAAALEADMLVVHHTPLWQPLTAVRGATMRLLRAVLDAGMNLYVMHTNFDRAPGGVNDTLAAILDLENAEPMSLGVVGDCRISLDEIGRRLGHGGLRVWGEIDRAERLAVIGGSGFDPAFIAEAADLGADAFLSAELKHSVARAAPIPCIEATHYALEAPAMEALAGRMSWHFIPDPPYVVLVP